jgi:hypothetical protein
VTQNYFKNLINYLQPPPNTIESDFFEPVDKTSFFGGFFCGLFKGGFESFKDLLSAVCSVGEGVWSFITNPIEFSKKMFESVIEGLNNIRELLTIETLSSIIPELKDLYAKWKTLSFSDRGEFIGKAIGTYGVDIAMTGGTIKAFRTYKKIKNANGLFPIEKISSAAQKVSIVKEANTYNAVYIDSIEKYKQAK